MELDTQIATADAEIKALPNMSLSNAGISWMSFMRKQANKKRWNPLTDTFALEFIEVAAVAKTPFLRIVGHISMFSSQHATGASTSQLRNTEIMNSSQKDLSTMMQKTKGNC